MPAKSPPHGGEDIYENNNNIELSIIGGYVYYIHIEHYRYNICCKWYIGTFTYKKVYRYNLYMPLEMHSWLVFIRRYKRLIPILYKR